MDRVDALTGLAMAVALLLVVFVENALRAAGLTTVAAAVYPVGYGAIVLSAWHLWIRPLDLRAPDQGDDVWRTDSDGGSQPRETGMETE